MDGNWITQLWQSEQERKRLQWPETEWGMGSEREPAEAQPSPWWARGLEYAFYPFTFTGQAIRGGVKEIGEKFQKPIDWSAELGRLTRKPEITPLSGEEFKTGWQSILPGGEKYEEYRELPLWQQMLWESPAYLGAAALPAAATLRAGLAPAAARPGLAGVLPTAARAALAPPAVAEAVIGAGLKYGIIIPAKYAIAVPIKKAFEFALDRGLDKWLVRQGIRGEEANVIVRRFLEVNNRKLFETAKGHVLARRATRLKGKAQETAVRQAADDTIRDIEPLLLKATKPVKPAEVIPKIPEGLATSTQKIYAHDIAGQKALISELGKMKPQYRYLAKAMTGQSSMLKMTAVEADRFIMALERLPEPTVRGGVKVPPSIPRTTRIVPENYFNLRFGQPTPVRLFTSQTYYAQKLGVKPLTEPLELAKQRFDLEFQAWSKVVDRKIAQINKIGGVSLAEQATAKIKNVPTKAVEAMRNLLDKYESPPPGLDPEGAKLFIWFRNTGRTILNGENQVRRLLGMDEIPYRQAYVRHTANALAQEILLGNRPLPEALKYWSQKIVGKKIFNPMEMQRKLAEDLEDYFTKDLAYATKSMLHTGLKEIHLSQPLQAFSEQMGAFTKDLPEYRNLPTGEFERLKKIAILPASTRRWVTDYVNQVIKGQQTYTDAEIDRLVTETGIGGLINKALQPFGRTVGAKPLTALAQLAGRGMILSVMTPRLGLVRMIIRNLFQHTQDMALYDITSLLKAYYPAKGTLKELLNESVFLKGYTGFEELPAALMGKIEKLALRPYGASATFNAKTAMKTAYWDTLPFIQNHKYKGLGWADPQRTYKEPRDFLYPSERLKLLKEMEFGAGVTQYSYIAMGMPEIFRHKAFTPLTRLQSWWMNHFFKFHREAMHRTLKGETGYGTKLPWRKRLNYLQYLTLGGALLTSLGYERSFLLGVLPYNLSPVGQFMIGLYNYATADNDWQRERGKKAMFNSWRAFVPGSLAWKEFVDVWSGKKPLRSIFFYEVEEGLPPHKPTWGIPPLKTEPVPSQDIEKEWGQLEELLKGTQLPTGAEPEGEVDWGQLEKALK